MIQKKNIAKVLIAALILSVSEMPPELTLSDYAHMDIDTAPEELRQTILDARSSILHDPNWTVDGQWGHYFVTDGERVFAPYDEFSKLFPGWDTGGYICRRIAFFAG